MNIPRVALILVVAVITASCSEKSASEPNGKSQVEETKPHQELPAGNQERAVDTKGEQSSTPDAQSAEAKEESERAPREDEIAEDCVAFVRSTKTAAPNGANADCPNCPVSVEPTEVLKFDDLRIDRVSPSDSTCEVAVTIRATFNPSTGGEIAGGLTGWISPEHKEQYLRGQTPSGPQAYKVKVTYRRAGTGWRAVEFN